MSKKKITCMNELLEAVASAINSAGPIRRDALAKTITAYREDRPDEYLWATGPQAPTLLSRLMMALTPVSLANLRNLTPMRHWLYNACLDGVWPVKCIEGFKNWDTGPIRFYYEDLNKAFHAWCKSYDIVTGGKRQRFSQVLAELHKAFPQINTRLRSRPWDGSLVHLTPSDGRARVIEIPPLSVCRENFDRIFEIPQDWPERVARSDGLGQSKKITNRALQAWLQRATPMRQWLYNACVDGVWPLKCIEGSDNWDTGPIRFFYEDLRSAFNAWCKHAGIVPAGMGQVHMREIFPEINTQLRLRVPEESRVARTVSDGKARGVELPSLSVCRKNFDRVLESPRDWAVKSAHSRVARNGAKEVVVPGFIRLKEFAKLADMPLSRLYLYHSRKLYGFPRAEREIGRVKLWDESAAVAWIQKRKAARRNAQSKQTRKAARRNAPAKQTRNQTSVRDFLYKACRSGRWPVRCIEGFENWETGPIRFFYADFRSKFHAWCKRSSNGGRKMSFLSDKIEEVHPTCNTRLRCRVPEASDVVRSPSDGRAQAIELPSLIDCRKDFDRLIKNPQDWPVKSAPRALDDTCVAPNDVEARSRPVAAATLQGGEATAPVV